jgi:hypothetical protein
MKNPHLFGSLLLAGLAFVLAPLAHAVTPVKGTKAPAAAQAQSSLQDIDYAALEEKIGARLVIDTTNDTTRTGVLVRYTNVSLTVQLGQDQGGIELSVPRTGIERVRIEVAPADPLFIDEKTPQKGDPGAKKN